MKRFLIPLVNEAFHEHYSDQAVVILEPNKLMTELPDGSFDHREMDAIATLSENGVEKGYHIEIETSTDQTFAVRIAEYAAGKAYRSVERTERGAKMTIPHSAVIFLRAVNEVPNEYVIEIEYPGGVVSYKAPVLKVKNYSVSEIFEKRLLLLLPFYGFHYDSEFQRMEKSGIDDLKTVLDEINGRLIEMVNNGDIEEVDRGHLIDWIKRVFEKLTVNYIEREKIFAVVRVFRVERAFEIN